MPECPTEPAYWGTIQASAELDDIASVDAAPKWLLVSLGYGGCALGTAVLVYAFLLWVGTGLNKQAFDAGTIVLLVALGIVGVLLILVGAKVVRRTRRSHL